jgi:hypothetical protein
MSKLTHAVIHLTCTQEVPGLNLSWDMNILAPLSLQANATSFHIHSTSLYSVILSLNYPIRSELTDSVIKETTKRNICQMSWTVSFLWKCQIVLLPYVILKGRLYCTVLCYSYEMLNCMYHVILMGVLNCMFDAMSFIQAYCIAYLVLCYGGAEACVWCHHSSRGSELHVWCRVLM